MTYKNKIVLITGSAGNLGSAVGNRFFLEGASLILLDHHEDRDDKKGYNKGFHLGRNQVRCLGAKQQQLSGQGAFGFSRKKRFRFFPDLPEDGFDLIRCIVLDVYNEPQFVCARVVIGLQQIISSAFRLAS